MCPRLFGALPPLLQKLPMEGRSLIAIVILLGVSLNGVDAVPCSIKDASGELWVNDTASATALASAVNCSGGVFNVEWSGMVVVEREIHVGGGTSLNIAGSGTEAGMEGSGSNRLFSVESAFLSVSNMTISNGNASFGGAIACDNSSMSFYQTAFIDNVAAQGNGGALYITDSSTVSWGGRTAFGGNSASGGGGGAFISDSSHVEWGGYTSFSDNSAYQGGALYVENNSTVSWEAETWFGVNSAAFTGGAVNVYNGSTVFWKAITSFSSNTGQWGGGMHVEHNSKVSWEAETLFSRNYAPGGGGAGLDIFDGSSVLWRATTRFIDNNATIHGGGMQVNAASVSWGANTVFAGNTCTADYSSGGAIFVFDGASASWTGETSFLNNSAGNGGAVGASIGSRASWEAETSFVGNSVSGSGGALNIFNKSAISWVKKTSFLNNSAAHGGAVLVEGGSHANWEAETSFIGNSANASGGALTVYKASAVSWVGESSFLNNTAVFGGGGAINVLNRSSASWGAETAFGGNSAEHAGGAVLMEYGSNVSWGASTSFRNNNAGASGGAISLSSSNENSEDIESSIFINGPTTFAENSCRSVGGAMAIIGVVSVHFQPGTIAFYGNAATFAGGAVFIADSGIGPRFIDVTFTSNLAGKGGAVSVTGSGTTLTNYKFLNPTTFDQCQFSLNKATIDGGAVETGAGHDRFSNTMFVGNVAQVGGALSLTGTASISNCTFVENASDEGEGPAISNVGSIANIENVSFAHNVFSCERGTFLDYNESGSFFETVCDGCGTVCTECELDADESRTPVCERELGNSKSTGGTNTVEMLLIDKGYWRTMATSEVVRPCYNADACLGGITGSAGYCQDGYKGPYCSICMAGFTSGPGYTCHSCSDATDGLVVAIVIAVLAIGAFAAFLFYMVAAESEGGGRGIMRRVARVIPLQSVKIIIVAWQILTQFSEVANVTYPGIYQDFLDSVDVLNFDLSWILSTGCIFDVDFHERLIMSTMGPLLGLAVLATTYIAGRKRNSVSQAALGKFRRKHLSMVIFLTFFVYSSVSSTLFQMFSCDELDDGKTYLRADYRIECDSPRHKSLQIYAGFMIVLYTMGIPVFYAFLLIRNRDVLMDEVGREVEMRVKPITNLWSPYQPQRFYYEVVECGRRILLAGVVVFIYPNTSAQVAATLVLSVFFIFISEALAPYASRWDTWVSRTGHATIFLSMYVGLLLKVDVSTEDTSSQRLFELILVSVNAFMITVVLAEAVVISCSLRYEEQEGPSTSKKSRGVTSFFEEKDGWPRPANIDDVETGENVVPRRLWEVAVPANTHSNERTD